MVLVNLPSLLATAFHPGEGLGEPEWHCKRTAPGLVLIIDPLETPSGSPGPGEALYIRIPGEKT